MIIPLLKGCSQLEYLFLNLHLPSWKGEKWQKKNVNADSLGFINYS